MEKNVQDQALDTVNVPLLQELDDNQLALIGGGIGDTCL